MEPRFAFTLTATVDTRPTNENYVHYSFADSVLGDNPESQNFVSTKAGENEVETTLEIVYHKASLEQYSRAITALKKRVETKLCAGLGEITITWSDTSIRQTSA